MQLLDLYPCKGVYQPGEAITLEAVIESRIASEGELSLTCYHLAQAVETYRFPVSVEDGRQTLPISFRLSANASRGYGIEAELVNHLGNETSVGRTAFDVQESWLSYPRYGFLTDFQPGRTGDSALKWLVRFHINGLQFYDWQYRHDQLLPPQEAYTDPLGRELSLNTVRSLIEGSHEKGIATLAYMAIYAASLPFAEGHQAWRMFDDRGQPSNFEDFLGLMDPSPGSPWVDHLLEQCDRTLSGLSFDGLHVDQYGESKIGFKHNGEQIDLPSAFQAFIESLKENRPDACVTFNAVKNWPIDELAVAPQDFVYIELWPETPTYQELYEIARGGRAKSGSKPVVIAQYIPVDHEANIRLSDALIFASGGSRIELGEQGRLLCDPYFPKHQAIPETFQNVLRRYYDFAVRYGELIGPSAESLEDADLSLHEGLLTVVRRQGDWAALHLINFTGIEGAHWCDLHPAPRKLLDLSIPLPRDWNIQAAWYASPDEEQIGLRRLEIGDGGERMHTVVPSLEYWSMLALELGDDPGSVHG
jgi:dextranase